MDIKTIEDIQRLVVTGITDWKQYGRVNVRERGDLLIFNYSQEAQFAAEWTPLERMSRGLIINRVTGEIVARPFDKFFNVGELGLYPSGPIRSVTEKVDGSLGILYRENGDYRIATRGSFDGEQALWATAFLNRYNDYSLPHKMSTLENELTLLFEIVYPSNRVVVDYGEAERLVLLAARNRFTGEYLPADDVLVIAGRWHFHFPRVYELDTVEDILALSTQIDANQEGWVIEMEDGSRWKVKGEEYKKLHRLITGLSFKWVLEAVAAGNVQQALEMIPDEFSSQVKQWLAEIDQRFNRVKTQCEQAFSCAPVGVSRKEYALWVMENYKPLSSYLFAMLDNRPIDQMIYKSLG